MAHVFVAMSGGVDSSTAALLLQEEGYQLTGVYLRMFREEELGKAAGESCGAQTARRDAEAVAQRLGFPFHTFDVSPVFRETVLQNFVREYQAGRTPNPCAVCNRAVKFGALLDQVRSMGADYLATGHYARVQRDQASGRYLLLRGLDRGKDQSYFLYMLTQEQLSHVLFPLGGLDKARVRQLAEEHGLVNAQKRDSQDICFIPDGDYAAFIRRHTGRDYPPGPFLDESGRVLGEHTGIIGYTLGQRRGLGVSSSRGRLYVKEVRPADNAVVLSGNESLFSRSLTAGGLNLIACARLDAPVRLRAKVRYRMAEQPCTAEQTGPDTLRVDFDQPQRAVTPGQTVVLYDGDTVVGGAVILKGEP